MLYIRPVFNSVPTGDALVDWSKLFFFSVGVVAIFSVIMGVLDRDS